MRRMMICAIVAGTAVTCLAMSACPVSASDEELSSTTLSDDDTPAPLVAPNSVSDFAPATEETPAFAWSSDPALTAPPYLSAAMETSSAPPSASATAIPLPAAAWTGFASLAGLGAVAMLRRLCRARL